MSERRKSALLHLDVVVVSLNGPGLLRRCLEALMPEATRDEGVEVAVVGDWEPEPEAFAHLREAFPRARWFTVPPGTTVPAKRWSGITNTHDALIALLEDDCVVPIGWCRALRAAHRSDDVAVGGGIEPGCYSKALDWAVYFCEYSRFMMPFSGRVAVLPGNNVSYKRTALVEFGQPEWPVDGFREIFFHRNLATAGMSLVADPSLSVTNINSWSTAHVLTMPYHHGRAFAGMRFRDEAWWRRPAFAGMTVLLPAVQVVRILRELSARRRFLSKLIMALPWVVLFCVSWSLGELVGYLAGPGTSPERWR